MALWYKETGPDHCRKEFANQTIHWSPSDTEDLYLENKKDPIKSKLLDELGWNADNITYSYNHQGFRCGQFDNRAAGIAIGCSLTEGVGINENQAWPSILSSLLGVHIWNMGIGGMGSASNFRMLLHYLPILKPKFVVHCVPNKLRFEYTNESDRRVSVLVTSQLPKMHEAFFKNWFLSDENSNLYSSAHNMAIKWLCHEQGIPYFGLKGNMFQHDHRARDLQHPGPKAHLKFAHLMHQTMLSKQGELKWN